MWASSEATRNGNFSVPRRASVRSTGRSERRKFSSFLITELAFFEQFTSTVPLDTSRTEGARFCVAVFFTVPRCSQARVCFGRPLPPNQTDFFIAQLHGCIRSTAHALNPMRFHPLLGFQILVGPLPRHAFHRHGELYRRMQPRPPATFASFVLR